MATAHLHQNHVGRPKGLAHRVRDLTGDFSAQINTMRAIAADDLWRDGKRQRVSTKDRMEAIKWLADRAYGKALETAVTVQGELESLGADLEIAREQIADLARHLKAADQSAIQTPDPAAKVA